MPLWDIDFSDIGSDTEIPEDIDDDENLPFGYNEEFEKVDNFLAENLERAKESKDLAMVDFVVEQAVLRYTRLGSRKDVLDSQIRITKQLRKGIIKNIEAEAKSLELKTQITYVQEMIDDQKIKESELRNRVSTLRAERDFKKSKLEAVIRSNRGSMSEISHINKRRALIQERLRLDTIEYEREKALRDDLRQTFAGYSKDLDRQLQNAPWLVEKQKKAVRRMELEDEIKILEGELVKLELIEDRNRIAEESERDLPFKQFCVQLAELYVKREKLFKQLEEEKAHVKKLEEQRRNRRAMEESSQMDCTQAILDGDLDDEETLMRMAKHYKIDTKNINAPITQERQSQLTQQICMNRAQSPTESTASSEANDEVSDVGQQSTVPPPAKRVSIIEAIPNPDESVDEGILEIGTQKENSLNESVMEEEANDDRSQIEQMETDYREEEEEVEERDEEAEERIEEDDVQYEEAMEHAQDVPISQEPHIVSQESVTIYVPGNGKEQERENNEFMNPMIPKEDHVATEENDHNIFGNGGAETSFNPEMMLNLSASSNDPGGDFFDIMNNHAAQKRSAADAVGGSPITAASDGDFMSMFGGIGGGDTAAVGGDATSFSFNFGGGDANESNAGGGEFNFFGF
ncbi:hypothetical protein PMAYCL1PPCAC_07497 [Pristionchus mayeri]|uniref:Uncharacterized protein n=1 Tax=Pristionchus mayeri TaxID=1317129 RepID=A0AAN4ZG60_9BILA|nr:hypothetical protein PMAYCL1PPCAC_07497 [Pristionchus mayeri]